jgi:outer membrane protein assembly factor BamA
MTGKLFMRFLFLTCLPGFVSHHSFSQKAISLHIITNDTLQKKVKKFLPTAQYTTKPEALEAMEGLLYNCYRQGYLSASIDSMVQDSISVTAYFVLGRQYRFVKLHKGNLDKYLINEVGFSEKQFAGKAFKYQEVAQVSEKLLSYCENNGYPFATFKLDSVSVDGNQVEASINFQKNNKITIDSLVLKGTAKIAKGFIYNYTGIKPGQLYNEAKFGKVAARLRELQFATVVKPAEVLFTEDKSKIFLYLDKRKASKFYGVIGILPNNQTTGKLLINGELKLSLLNSFGRGELIDLHWQSVSRGTQDLKVNLAYPYLFGTPFGINYKFLLYKKDTSYLTLTHNIGLQYFFLGANYVKVFADIYKSNLLNTTGFEGLTVLPDFADVSATLFGLDLNFEKYNYKLNPTRGYQVYFFGAAGQKNIRKNSALNPILYDSIRLRSTQFKFMLSAEVFIPAFRKTTVLLRTENAYLFNQTIFVNEMFKLGGLRSLRGFDEESILASSYEMFLLEFRYLFEKNSFFAVFFNTAYYEKRSPQYFVHDIPYGFGAGLAFDTKIGQFQLYYALGSQFGQAVSFKQGKIHFGFTNTF